MCVCVRECVRAYTRARVCVLELTSEKAKERDRPPETTSSQMALAIDTCVQYIHQHNVIQDAAYVQVYPVHDKNSERESKATQTRSQGSYIYNINELGLYTCT